MRPRPRFFTLSCMLALGLPACGKATGDDADELADDGETNGGSCEIEFEQPAPGTSGTFTVRNDRAVPIYIPQSISTCTFEAWQVLDGDTQVFWNDAYVPTCTDLLADDCNWGCSDGPASAIKLEPGATWTEAWGYYVWAPVQLSEACVEGTQCAVDATCWAGRAKLDGQLTARLRVTETCEFGEACDCGSSACLVEIDSLSIAAVEAELVDLSFDASSSDILLVID